MRIGRRQRKSKASVTLQLHTHGGRDPYMNRPPNRDTRSILVESALNVYSSSKPQNAVLLDHFLSNSRYDRTASKYLNEANRRGIPIFAGESLPGEGISGNPPENWVRENVRIRGRSAKGIHAQGNEEYAAMRSHRQKIEQATIQNPSMENIRRTLQLLADENIFRERLILYTIEHAPKPIEARYGSMHSTLTRGIQQSGLTLEREIQTQPFDPYAQVIRKMVIGKNPTEDELRNAWISRYMPEKYWKILTTKNSNHASFKEANRIDLLQHVLLNRLAKRKPTVLADIAQKIAQNPMEFSRVLTENELSSNPSKKEIQTFLNRYSIYERREKTIKKMNNRWRRVWRRMSTFIKR